MEVSLGDALAIVVGLISGVAWLITNVVEIKHLKSKNKEVEDKVILMEEAITFLKEQRYKDLQLITETLNKFNLNLTKFDMTLNNVNTTIRDMKVAIEHLSEK